jgi:hypothetical protein
MLRITLTRISSTVPGCDSIAERREDGWHVTGHPGRVFTQDQAVTAMLIAEVEAFNLPPDDRTWKHVAQWRTEIGLPPQGRPPAEGPVVEGGA